MPYQLLTTSWQRAAGAMFRKPLINTVLAFVYPHSVPRLFHTFFCRPLRIIALSDHGEILFNQVIPPHRFVRLPATRLILETDPNRVLIPEEVQTLARSLMTQRPPSLSTGAVEAEVNLHKLLFALVADALGDIRRLKERCHLRRGGELTLEVLQTAFTPEERGQTINSAAFLLDFSDGWRLPNEAYTLARRVLSLERKTGFMAELVAASIAGSPWKAELPRICLRCQGASGRWRPVLTPPTHLPREVCWRYERPENHIYLCRKCAYKIGWMADETIRLAFARGVWGARFEALRRWHIAASWHLLPARWDKAQYPLWPAEYGGASWETGSGALSAADPRPPDGIACKAAEVARMKKCLGNPRPRRLPTTSLQEAVC